MLSPALLRPAQMPLERGDEKKQLCEVVHCGSVGQILGSVAYVNELRIRPTCSYVFTLSSIHVPRGTWVWGSVRGGVWGFGADPRYAYLLTHPPITLYSATPLPCSNGMAAKCSCTRR